MSDDTQVGGDEPGNGDESRGVGPDVSDVVDAGPQPQPEETVEVRPGMAQDDADAALDQGVIGSDPSWGPLGLDENENDELGGDDEGDPVVQALIAALRSGNSGDAENAISLASEAGHDVSAFGNVPIQGKRDLAALEAEAVEAAEEAEDEVEDES